IFPDSPYGAVTTSRSCPHRCTFCAYSGGTAYKERCLDGVFDEIDYLIGKYKIKKLSLSDELFSTRIERLIEFCLRIKPYGLKWRVFLRASGNLTADVTEAMFSAGCEAVYFGLESADDRILKSMKKGITLKDIEHSLALTKAAGIHTTGAFIFGDTNETMETAQNTINWIFDNINLFDWVTLEPIILYPGSQLYDDAVKRGAIKDTTEFIKNGCPLLNISKLTDSEYWHLIEEILPEANKKLQHKALSDYARTGKKRWIPT
ncbi:MAG: radical SAM protein, partial [Oscillospiraceae bacterium]|nr:radical SAM protein [Oscillospiraceae bacterium]